MGGRGHTDALPRLAQNPQPLQWPRPGLHPACCAWPGAPSRSNGRALASTPPGA